MQKSLYIVWFMEVREHDTVVVNGLQGTVVFIYYGGEAFEVEFFIPYNESVLRTVFKNQIEKVNGETYDPGVDA